MTQNSDVFFRILTSENKSLNSEKKSHSNSFFIFSSGPNPVPALYPL